MLSSLAVALLLVGLPGTSATAQEDSYETMFVVVSAGHQRTLDNLNYIGELAQNDELAADLSKLMAGLMQVQGLDLMALGGIVPDRPWVFAVRTDQVNLFVLGMLPVSDVEATLNSLAPLVGPFNKGDDGVYKLGEGEMTGFVKVHDGWAYFAQLPDHLASLPAPAELLGDLPGDYDFALRVNVSRIPEAFRTLAVDWMRGIGVAGGGGLLPATGRDGIANAFVRAVGDHRDHLVERCLTEVETMTLGLRLDQQAGKGLSELHIRPLTGSSLDGHLDQLAGTKTRFGGLIDSASKSTVQMNLTGPLDEKSSVELSLMLAAYRATVVDAITDAPEITTDEQRLAFIDLTGGIVDAIDQTVRDGTLDGVLRVAQAGRNFRVIGAIHVTDGAAIAAQLERYAQWAESDEGSPTPERTDHNGTTIYGLAIEEAPGLQMLSRVFGASRLYMAARPDSFWVALGPEALEQLRVAMDGPEAEVPPMRLEMKAAQLVSIGSQLADDQNLRTMLAVMRLGLGGTADQMIVEAAPSGRALVVKGELGRDVLRVPAMVLPAVSSMLLQGGRGIPGLGR